MKYVVQRNVLVAFPIFSPIVSCTISRNSVFRICSSPLFWAQRNRSGNSSATVTRCSYDICVLRLVIRLYRIVLGWHQSEPHEKVSSNVLRQIHLQEEANALLLRQTIQPFARMHHLEGDFGEKVIKSTVPGTSIGSPEDSMNALAPHEKLYTLYAHRTTMYYKDWSRCKSLRAAKHLQRPWISSSLTFRIAPDMFDTTRTPINTPLLVLT